MYASFIPRDAPFWSIDDKEQLEEGERSARRGDIMLKLAPCATGYDGRVALPITFSKINLVNFIRVACMAITRIGVCEESAGGVHSKVLRHRGIIAT